MFIFKSINHHVDAGEDPSATSAKVQHAIFYRFLVLLRKDKKFSAASH